MVGLKAPSQILLMTKLGGEVDVSRESYLTERPGQAG